MRCPKCGYVSFDDLDRCKRCGYGLADVQRERPLVTAQPRPAATGTEKKAAPEARRHSFPTFDKQPGADSAATLTTVDDAALRREQETIRRQMDTLDQERQRLHRASLDFEQRQQSLEKKLREEIAVERRAAQGELARLRETQADLLQQMGALERSRQEAENTFRTLAADRERLHQQEAELADHREKIREEEERARAIGQEVQRLAAVSQQLKEEHESLRREREEADRARQAAERARQDAERSKREAVAARLKAEKARAEAARKSAPADAPSVEPLDFDTERERWRSSLQPEAQPTAGDFVRVLADRRREERAPAPPTKPAAAAVVLEEEELADDTGVTLEEVEETFASDEPSALPLRARHVAPKGGLIFRLAAGLVDLSLLLVVLGIFLVIGRLATGGSGNLAQLVSTLALPFYLLFVLLTMVYVTYLHGSSGQTLGKRLLRLRVLTTHGQPVGYVNAFLRFVATLFAVALLGLGILGIALDPNKQGWHDKIARTVVVRL